MERYKDNKEFISQEYWKLTGKDGHNDVDFHWMRKELSLHLFDKAVAEVFIIAIKR